MADTHDAPATTVSHRTTPADDDDSLSPLEQEVLDEYARLLGNLNAVRLPSTHSPVHKRYKSYKTQPYHPLTKRR